MLFRGFFPGTLSPWAHTFKEDPVVPISQAYLPTEPSLSERVVKKSDDLNMACDVLGIYTGGGDGYIKEIQACIDELAHCQEVKARSKVLLAQDHNGDTIFHRLAADPQRTKTLRGLIEIAKGIDREEGGCLYESILCLKNKSGETAYSIAYNLGFSVSAEILNPSPEAEKEVEEKKEEGRESRRHTTREGRGK